MLQELAEPIRFPEGENGLVVNLETELEAQPFPISFEWTSSEGTLQNDSSRSFGYPTLSIDNVQRSDSGTYTLTATNSVMEDDASGTATGSFVLDVLCKFNQNCTHKTEREGGGERRERREKLQRERGNRNFKEKGRERWGGEGGGGLEQT